MRKMIDMKRTQAEKSDATDLAMPSVSDAPDYPYGLGICLTGDELDKLDLPDDCEVGDMIDIRAMGVVTSVSKRQVNGSSECRVEIQLTHIGLEDEETEDE